MNAALMGTLIVIQESLNREQQEIFEWQKKLQEERKRRVAAALAKHRGAVPQSKKL